MKHKLKLEDLELSTFSVLPAPRGAGEGTVQGHSVSEVSCLGTDFYACTCGSGASADTFCPTGGECVSPSKRPAQSCRPSCINYTCEGITCGTLIC